MKSNRETTTKENKFQELKHQQLIAKMTLEEKASLTSGANFWQTKEIEHLGIPGIMVSDGPHGLRKQTSNPDHLGINASVLATCFPTAATLANSWNMDLIYQVGKTVGAEAAAEHVSVLLGPGLNIKRNPLGGRNFEYFSEDPYLSGKLAAALIKGAQSNGIGACPKHYAVNSQETYRMSIDEVVDERALHEIYLEGFRIAVTEGKPLMLMTSYNKVNGTYAHEHPELVGKILRGRWGFAGTVISDWGGNNDGAAAIAAGSNLEMPASKGITERRIIEAVNSGELDEADLDKRIDEFLTLLDQVSDDVKYENSDNKVTIDFDAHHEAARKAAEDAIVLLKNDDSLPLNSSEKIAVIGDFAKTPRYQGAGSSKVNPTRVISPLDALQNSDLNIISYEAGFKRQDSPSKKLADSAIASVEAADTVLLFIGLDESSESEGADRAHMRIAQNQLKLTQELIKTGKKIVVVLVGGAPVELPFADDVSAIVHSYLPGQAGGDAITNILSGKVNPSGKLAETYPIKYEDVASAKDYTRDQASAEHRDSIYIGYRYYDKIGLPVRYPFGHGLSYTAFKYDDAQVSSEKQGVPETIEVTVSNTGKTAGAEVVQVYIEATDAKETFRAVRELAGFTKVQLASGESKKVQISLSDNAFSAYDVQADTWSKVAGNYKILVGASSRDIQATITAEIVGNKLVSPEKTVVPHYFSGKVQDVDDKEFETLLGRTPPKRNWDANVPLTEESILAQLPGHSLAANLSYVYLKGRITLFNLLKQPGKAGLARMQLTLPIRTLPRMFSDSITEERQQQLIDLFNGDESILQFAKRMRTERKSKN
ncbi:MAG: glycoside hydrolase family 3 C-terminal domain-containing protein [Micrococcaceae bacterium]